MIRMMMLVFSFPLNVCEPVLSRSDSILFSSLDGKMLTCLFSFVSRSFSKSDSWKKKQSAEEPDAVGDEQEAGFFLSNQWFPTGHRKKPPDREREK